MRNPSVVICLTVFLLSGCVSSAEYEPPSGLRSALPEQTFGGGLSGESITDSEWTNIINTTLNSVVKVEVETCDGSGSGSGFRIGNWIVTNRHVVEDAIRVDLKTLDQKYFQVKSWYPSLEDDLALLELPPSSIPPLQSASTDAIPGDLVALVGYPLGGGQDVRRGRIFDIEEPKEQDSKTFIFSVTAEALPGDSGGPAINAQGQVIGVTYAINLIESRALVVPVSRVRELLQSRPDKATPKECSE